MGKLKSSLKSLQEVITSLKQTGPICIQEAKTHSFRSGEGLSCSFSNVSHNFPPTLIHQKHSVHMKDLSSSSSSSASSSQPKDGRLCSKRFFFSPHKTKSIMEEVKEDASLFRTKEMSDGKMIAMIFNEESQAIAMVSEDPYRDFKCSMEEMVEAYEIIEWPRLTELLHCYLRLNSSEYHKIIVHAFVDLLIALIAEDKEIYSFSLADSVRFSI